MADRTIVKPVTKYPIETQYYIYDDVKTYFQEKNGINIDDVNGMIEIFRNLSDRWSTLHPNLKPRYRNFEDWCKKNKQDPREVKSHKCLKNWITGHIPTHDGRAYDINLDPIINSNQEPYVIDLMKSIKEEFDIGEDGILHLYFR